MPPPSIFKSYRMKGPCPTWEEAGIVLLGAPMDTTSSWRPGSRFAPSKIRAVFESIEDYSLYQDAHFSRSSLYDWGDVQLPRGNVSRELEVCREAVSKIVAEGKKPFIIGGEHTVALAGVKSLLEKEPELEVLHLDAHADLRPAYLGETQSHASVVYQFLKAGIRRVYQLGVRSCTGEELSLARERTQFYPFQLLSPLKRIISSLERRPVYVTLDIDVVDPAYAPGTGTPEPGGVTSQELLEALLMLREVNVVGFDLVEVNPTCDYNDITSVLAAKIVREAALLL